VELPEDEPATVRLLVQYLYEGEYDPKLSQGSTAGKPVVTAIKVNEFFHYEFPHTCERGCPEAYMVCHHHECTQKTCGEKCVNFICKECTKPLPPEGDSTQLLLHAEMYEIGDKYDVVGLKQLAREKFSRVCTAHWNDDHFAPAAHYAFSTTPEEDNGLRGLISSTLSTHMDLLNKPGIQALLNEFNGLAVGLLNLRAKELGWIKPSA
jgi:hypothetical protein